MQESGHMASCNKLHATNWLKNNRPPVCFPAYELVEVRFKNSRKEFFAAPPDMELEEGDIVAVESSPGHDIGIVSLAGEVVRLQLKKKKSSIRQSEFKKVYRRARVSDIEKWTSAIKSEDQTMLRSREIASSLKLQMKISDVEYQGDRTKATFYYTADDRVDFRVLIRSLAEAFNVRIEMRQIGMRQEASRLGGIASCGRELCCSTWLTNFRTVSTNAARNQQLSLNPQKLAGQCGKLKCCINYEDDIYADALRNIPDTSVVLQTSRGPAVFQKMDVLRMIMGYSYKDSLDQIVMIPADRVREIIELNQRKKYPEDLLGNVPAEIQEKPTREIDQPAEDSLTRFDNPGIARKKKKRKKKKPGNSSMGND